MKAIANNSPLWHPWPYHLLRLGLGLLFVWAGALKLMDVAGFARVISQYNLAPDYLLAPLALGLPVLEVLAGLGLMAEVRGSLGAITGMLVLFALVLWFGVLQGLEVDCGCFSTSELRERDGLRQALARDLVMLAAAGYLHAWRKTHQSPDRVCSWRWKLITAKE